MVLIQCPGLYFKVSRVHCQRVHSSLCNYMAQQTGLYLEIMLMQHYAYRKSFINVEAEKKKEKKQE